MTWIIWHGKRYIHLEYFVVIMLFLFIIIIIIIIIFYR